jgi:hypothetical protein
MIQFFVQRSLGTNFTFVHREPLLSSILPNMKVNHLRCVSMELSQLCVRTANFKYLREQGSLHSVAPQGVGKKNLRQSRKAGAVMGFLVAKAALLTAD